MRCVITNDKTQTILDVIGIMIGHLHLLEDRLAGAKLGTKSSQHANHGCTSVDGLRQEPREGHHLCKHPGISWTDEAGCRPDIS